MDILLVHNFTINESGGAEFGGCEYYRMQKPLEVLNRMYPEFKYATVQSVNDTLSDEFLKQFDLIIFSRRIADTENTIARLDKLGIPFGMDLDDYWVLPEEHILYDSYKETGESKVIEESIRSCGFVTTSTELLASKIHELNPNVHVIENGIDTEDKTWKPNKQPNKRIRYGFTQGTTHVPDVYLIHKEVQRAMYDRKFYGNSQIVLCGFNALPNEGSVYIGYERLLTDSLKTLKYDLDYAIDLVKLNKPEGSDKPYKRIWAKDVDVFGTVYDEIDVSVVPLLANEFNSCKSNIKMLEAGFKDCAVMVSNVSPYVPLATKENSFLLSEKNFMEWQRYISLHPEIIEEKKFYLKRDIERFALKNLTDKRKELYERFNPKQLVA